MLPSPPRKRLREMRGHVEHHGLGLPADFFTNVTHRQRVKLSGHWGPPAFEPRDGGDVFDVIRFASKF